MQEFHVHEYARQLWEAHGAKAIAEAAQKASTFEKEGKKDRADSWRRIQAALLHMRGPRQA